LNTGTAQEHNEPVAVEEEETADAKTEKLQPFFLAEYEAAGGRKQKTKQKQISKLL
jgi:hypothetical protein